MPGSMLTTATRTTRGLLERAGLLKPRDPYLFRDLDITRSTYKAVWERVSASENAAKISVGGSIDEARFLDTAMGTVASLEKYVGVRPDDVVLEIGAGVGRVGSALAPRCKEWIGADVAPNMVAHMQRRLAGMRNARAIEINGFDLDVIPSESIDLVYCTVVFMHLEEFERYRYIAEGMRVLRPGGRMYVDNANLASPDGWAFFEKHLKIPVHRRPPHISKPSTPQELACYFEHAGFEAIGQAEAGIWIITHGRKPAAR